MSFIPQQEFNEDGVIETIVKKRKILESVESQEDGKVTGKARVKIETGTLTAEDCQPYHSIEEAEGMILTECEIFWPMSRPPLNHIPESEHNAYRLSRAIANIGEMSKRGPGNTIIVYPELRAKVEAALEMQREVEQPNPFDPEGEPQKVQMPYFDPKPRIIEHEEAPDDTVLVIYMGEEENDQPLVWVEGYGLILNNKVTDVENYGKFVRIE